MGSKFFQKVFCSPYFWLTAILIITLVLYFQSLNFGWITGLDQKLVGVEGAEPIREIMV